MLVPYQTSGSKPPLFFVHGLIRAVNERVSNSKAASVRLTDRRLLNEVDLFCQQNRCGLLVRFYNGY